jgi:hypothetical protein
MARNPVRALLITLFLMSAGIVAGAGPERLAMPETLDHKAVHQFYNEGDFESVTAALGDFMNRNRFYSHEDSVFIAKHLAVVYCANPATREKGRYYMYRLLELVPSAKLVDMYVSEEIDRIFEKVRDEFRSRQPDSRKDSARVAMATRAPAKDPTAPAAPPAAAASAKSSHRGLWIAGGAAALAAGAATAYLISQNEDEPTQPHYRVPRTVSGE